MAEVFEVGRVCIKTRGRMAGNLCVVTGIIDKSFAEITGPKEITGIKRKRSNIDHLEPTKHKLDIKEKADDKAVIAAIEKAGAKSIFEGKKKQ